MERMEFKSRTQLLEFAMENQIAVPKDKQNEAPYSMDANLPYILRRKNT